MLKQIKALGLVLVIGGMLVGCEETKEIENIDLQGAVDSVEEFVDNINDEEEYNKLDPEEQARVRESELIALMYEAMNVKGEGGRFEEIYRNEYENEMDIEQFAQAVAAKKCEEVEQLIEERDMQYLNFQHDEIAYMGAEIVYKQVIAELNNYKEQLEEEAWEDYLPKNEEVYINKVLANILDENVHEGYIDIENGIFLCRDEFYECIIYADETCAEIIGVARIDVYGNFMNIVDRAEAECIN
jgi:hypothetical protein